MTNVCVSDLAGSALFAGLSFPSLPKSHPRATAVLVDEFDPGAFASTTATFRRLSRPSKFAVSQLLGALIVEVRTSAAQPIALCDQRAGLEPALI